MRFTILPYRHFSAAANMAIDSGMMVRSKERDEILFRYYGWTEAAVTIGYSQPLDVAPSREENAVSTSLARVRRETGGGVVDHRHDLTYALAIPRSHPAWSERPQTVYRALHAALSTSFEEWGVATHLAPCVRTCGSAPASECFTRAEPDDVVESGTGRKLAGAAMRRHRDALLLQGSIERTASLGMLDEPLWRKSFTAVLAEALESSPPVLEEHWPRELPEPSIVSRFASRKWNERR